MTPLKSPIWPLVVTIKAYCEAHCILNLFRNPGSMICLQTPSFVWCFQDGRQLASKLSHHKHELLDPVLFFRPVQQYYYTHATCFTTSLLQVATAKLVVRQVARVVMISRTFVIPHFACALTETELTRGQTALTVG